MPSPGMRAFVPPVPIEPLPHGLLSGCLDIVTTTDMHELNGTDHVSSSCGQLGLWQGCPDVDPSGVLPPFTNPESKLFERPETVTSEPITITSGIECSTFGLSFEEGRARAVESLAAGEQSTLEKYAMSRVLPRLAFDNVVGPGTPVNITLGLGLLEDWMAQTHGYRGVIHVPSVAGPLLSRTRAVPFLRDNECLGTLAGNRVVIGAYGTTTGPYTEPLTPPVPAPAGSVWLYITPPMRIRRDAAHLVLREEWQGLNTVINDRRALAESTFVIETACESGAAVLVSLDQDFTPPAEG